MFYLACPYSHEDADIRESRFRLVSHVAGLLMRQGKHVFSPISHSHPIAEYCGLPLDWEYWEVFDRMMIECCTRMLVLKIDGWETSKGVSAEIKIAQELNMPVHFVDASGTIGDEIVLPFAALR